MGLDGAEQGDSRVCVGLILLAHGTTFNILAYELHKTQPLKFGGYELAGFEVAGMPGSFVVMAAGEDGTLERVLQENIDMTFVGEDVVVEFPVRETRPEGRGDVF